MRASQLAILCSAAALAACSIKMVTYPPGPSRFVATASSSSRGQGAQCRAAATSSGHACAMSSGALDTRGCPTPPSGTLSLPELRPDDAWCVGSNPR